MDLLRCFFCLVVVVSILLAKVSGIFQDGATYDDLSDKLGTVSALLFITVRWCDHCIALKSELKALANAARLSEDILVAQVDADDEPGVASKLGVTGFPTILYVPFGHGLASGRDGVVEFADYRWAEIIADFVNNETKQESLKLHPRKAFLKWREKHPYNIGKGKKDKTASEERIGKPHILPEMTAVREPEAFNGDQFLQNIFSNAGTRFIILLYKNDDPFIRDVMVQWRQATSAFTGADNITVGVVNLSDDANKQLGETLRITDTPLCLYYPRCENGDLLPACKEPLSCDDDLDNTENIIQFLSDRILEEMGVQMRETEREGKAKTYHLTEEQYQQLKAGGKIFANDPDHTEKIRDIYNAATEHETIEDKDEL